MYVIIIQSVWSMMAYIQAACRFRIKIFAITSLIAIKHNSFIALVTVIWGCRHGQQKHFQENTHEHKTMHTVQWFWNANKIPCREGWKRRIRSKAISRISLNFLHLIIQKEQNWVHILFYSLLVDMKRGKNILSSHWLTCILLYSEKLVQWEKASTKNMSVEILNQAYYWNKVIMKSQ